MAAQTQDQAQNQASNIQPAHPMTGVQEYFTSVWKSLELIPDAKARRRAQKALKASWDQMAGLMEDAQREIQSGDALIQAALAAATALSEQRGEALKEIARLQQHLDARDAGTYARVMESIAIEIGNAMGINPEAARLLFDALIGDLDDFPEVYGISGEQIHAFRGAMVAMLTALRGGES
jgi:hypothetical protein